MILKVSHAAAVMVSMGALMAAAGCSSASDELGLEEDVGVVQSELRKGTPGAAIGHSNYCDDPLNPCSAGEGDCDSSTQCQSGLVCGRNKLSQFGMPQADACVPAHCVNKIKDGAETQIDCGADCGTVCAAPVCKPIGPGRCNSDCLCGVGEGDCDTNSQCVAPLVCSRGKLAQFGTGTGGACVPAHCTNKQMDAGETQVDCGGDCGSVCVGSPPPPPPDPDRLVFVTSQMSTGNLGGLAGADAACQSMATAANLVGTYKAFLSDSTSSASARLSRGTAAYKLVDGTVVAATAADFFSSSHLAPIDLDENGSSTGGEVWTGSLSNGSGSGGCANWTSTGGTAFVGLNVLTDARWARIYSQFCDRNNVRLYCVQQ